MSTQPAHKRKVTRGSGRNRNARGTSGSIQNSQSHSNQVTVPGVYSNAHFVHAAAVLKGLKVQVVVLSNTKYEGIFSTISPSAEIVLELAHMVEGTNTVPNKERIMEKLILKAKDVVSLTAKDVDLDYAVKSDIQSGFMTDTDISGKKSNGQAGERELEQWTPSNETSADLSLDGDTNGWSAEDMFNANKKRFGYESSYDKSLQDYTTVLHKDDSEEFRIKQERANKIAREIEESAGYNQRAEIELDDGQTEEERFSAVQRPKPRMSPSQQTRSGSPKGNMQFDKYIPPPLRSNPNPKPTQRNYNQSSHKPHPQAQPSQRVHTQHTMRQPRVHMGTDDRLNMQDVRMDNRASQDVRLSSQDARLSPQDARLSPQDARLSPQDARLAYEPRSQRSAAQVVAGTTPQHGMVPQQTNVMKPREVKPEPMGRTPSPGPPVSKQPTKDIARVPSPMAESNPHQPVTEDKKTQKSQKTQKIIELNEFSNNFRLQDNQNSSTNNHASTQVIEPKPVKSNPAAPAQVNQQPPAQSPQLRPVQPTTQPHPPAAVTQVIPPQPLPQVGTPKLAQVPPAQVLILQQPPQPTLPQPAAQPTRPVEEKKSDFKLNPNAKEFILNPSAKPFTPQLRKVSHSKTPTPPRPQSRQSQSPTLHQPIQVQHVIPGGGQPQFVLNPVQPQLIYTQIPTHKKFGTKSTATNIPPSQRPQQPGELPSAQVISVSNATGPPLVAPPHFQHLPTYPQHPVTHPGQILPGQTILQPHPMHPMIQMQQQKLSYRSGHPNPLSNVPQSQTQLHSLPPDVSGNPPVFVTPQGPNQVYPGQQQQSLYGQQGSQQHPPGTHHQMVPSSHPHPHGGPQPVQNQGLGQPHQGQQGHRPTPSPVQHPIQSPSQPTQPGVILYNMPQHSQPIQGHTPQSQQTFTTVLMHQQQQQPQPQPYSATSHSITNMTTVHTSPHPHPHVQPNMMYVGQTGPPHSHTVMLPSGIPSGNIQYLPQQQGQGQHPPIQAYQQSN